jgi:DNA-binding NarL/FixJ family response regulator
MRGSSRVGLAEAQIGRVPGVLTREASLSGAARIALLAPRERQVLELVARGLTDRGIARNLCLSQKTVEHYVRRIFRRLNLPASCYDNRRVQAATCWLAAAASEKSLG